MYFAHTSCARCRDRSVFISTRYRRSGVIKISGKILTKLCLCIYILVLVHTRYTIGTAVLACIRSSSWNSVPRNATRGGAG